MSPPPVPAAPLQAELQQDSAASDADQEQPSLWSQLEDDTTPWEPMRILRATPSAAGPHSREEGFGGGCVVLAELLC